MQEEEEDAKKVCCCSKRVSVGVTAFLFLVCGIVGVTVTCLYLEQKVLKYNHHYGVIFDAGSSHTDLTVYRWPSQYKDCGTAHTQELLFTNCSDVGISSFTEEPEKAGEAIQSCIKDFVVKSIPHRDIKKTPIYLGATAGMRLLCERDKTSCNAILDSIRQAFNRFAFRQTQDRVHVLTGEEEALFGWTTANILNGALNGSKPASNSSLIGSLDMGGGSMEVAFVPNSTLEARRGSVNNLTLYGNTYSIYAHSYLCYGFNEAQRKLMASLVEASNFTTDIPHPCLNRGLNITRKADYVWLAPCSALPSIDIFPLNNKTVYSFYGIGSVEKCESELKKLFNKTSCKNNTENCTFNGIYQPPLTGQFAAFAGFGKTARGLNASGRSLVHFKNKGEEFCKQNLSKVRGMSVESKFVNVLCFQALYSYQLLTNGLNFVNTTNMVNFMENINGAAVGWSLGFMVNKTNSINVEPTTYRISNQEYIILLVVFSLCTVLGMASLCICITKNHARTRMKYKYSMVS